MFKYHGQPKSSGLKEGITSTTLKRSKQIDIGIRIPFKIREKSLGVEAIQVVYRALLLHLFITGETLTPIWLEIYRPGQCNRYLGRLLASFY